MITPKITYNAGAGVVTLQPTFPPIQKPLSDELEATRHDSITSSGIKQSITERTDSFITLNFATVPAADIANWKAFMVWALAGGVFTYFPDNTNSGVHTDYTMEETKWVPKFSHIGNASFTFRMRQVV